jgi:hypothetical protein
VEELVLLVQVLVHLLELELVVGTSQALEVMPKKSLMK